MTNTNPVIAIEKRIAALEKKVFDETVDNESLTICEKLIDVRKKLEGFNTAYQNIAMWLSKIDKINLYLKMLCGTDFMENDNVKANLIILSEGELRYAIHLLNVLEKLRKYLDSEPIEQALMLSLKFYSTNKIHLNQLIKFSHLKTETVKLVEQYNNIISYLQKIFILWDTSLTSVEIQKNCQSPRI